MYDHSKDLHEWTNQIKNKDFAADLLILRSKVPALKDMAPKLRGHLEHKLRSVKHLQLPLPRWHISESLGDCREPIRPPLLAVN